MKVGPKPISRGYDCVVMIATSANSISNAFLDFFCLLLVSNVIFRKSTYRNL